MRFRRGPDHQLSRLPPPQPLRADLLRRLGLRRRAAPGPDRLRRLSRRHPGQRPLLPRLRPPHRIPQRIGGVRRRENPVRQVGRMTGGRARQVKGRTVHPVRPFAVLWEPLTPAPCAHGCWSSLSPAPRRPPRFCPAPPPRAAAGGAGPCGRPGRTGRSGWPNRAWRRSANA